MLNINITNSYKVTINRRIIQNFFAVFLISIKERTYNFKEEFKETLNQNNSFIFLKMILVNIFK